MGAWGPGELVASGLAAPGPQAARAFADPFARDLFSAGAPWKAVSIWQPWASLVARGVKTWITPLWEHSYRGPIAIHAARILDVASSPDDLCLSALGVTWTSDLPHSAAVGVAELVEILPATAVLPRLTHADRAAGNVARGRHAWQLQNVRALRRPVPTPGRQGLFNWHAPEDLHDRLGPVLDTLSLSHQIGWGKLKRVFDA